MTDFAGACTDNADGICHTRSQIRCVMNRIVLWVALVTDLPELFIHAIVHYIQPSFVPARDLVDALDSEYSGQFF